MRLLAILALSTGAHAALMPLPPRVVYRSGRLPITANFSVRNENCPAGAIARFQLRLARQADAALSGGGPGLTVACHESAPEYPALGENEAYVLDVGAGGARLDAATVTGILRGFETFSQLMVDSGVPAVHIEDRPRWKWRGLMIDV